MLVSVLPEAGRGQDLGDDAEFYFAVKKLVDVTVSMNDVYGSSFGPPGSSTTQVWGGSRSVRPGPAP